MSEEKKEVKEPIVEVKDPAVDADVTPPPVVQEAELADAKKVEEIVPEGEVKSSQEEIEIIEAEIAKIKAGDEKSVNDIKEQIEKLKIMTAELQKQQSTVKEEKEVIEQTRKGYATIPATDADADSSSAQPVKKEAQELYDEASNAERYAEFEKQFGKR